MPDEQIAPEKVIINGVEYDAPDAQRLIDLGSKADDFQKQWNTDLSKVMPDYTRSTQEAAQLRKDLEAREQRIKEYEAKARQAETPEEQTRALEAARKIGLLDRDVLKQEGYLTKTEMESYFQTKQKEQQDTQAIMDTGQRLEKEIDGTDGRVSYNPKAVLAYASSYGFFDGRRSYEQALKDAYSEMYERQNAGWKQQQLDSAKRPGLTTLKGGGSKQPAQEKKITSMEDANEALKEILWQGSDE